MRARLKSYALVICLTLSLPALAVNHHFQTINPFNSVETSARGVNNNGDIVGDFANAALAAKNSELGFLDSWDGFSKIKVPGARDTDSNGINNEGDIVGTFDDSWGDHGYVLASWTFYRLADPPSRFDRYPDYNAINDYDEIVGVATPKNSGGNRGFLLTENGTYYTIIDCGKYQTEANGINDDEDIVGECSDQNNVEHAFLLHNGCFTIFDFPGATGTVAYGINNDGDVVGSYSDGSGNDHGFIAFGLVEGYSEFETVDFPHATDTKVAAINDCDEIVGTYTDSTGRDNGFRAQF